MKTTVGKCSYINLNQTVRSSFDLRKCDPRVSVSLWEMRIAKFRRSVPIKERRELKKMRVPRVVSSRGLTVRPLPEVLWTNGM